MAVIQFGIEYREPTITSDIIHTTRGIRCGETTGLGVTVSGGTGRFVWGPGGVWAPGWGATEAAAKKTEWADHHEGRDLRGRAQKRSQGLWAVRGPVRPSRDSLLIKISTAAGSSAGAETADRRGQRRHHR